MNTKQKKTQRRVKITVCARGREKRDFSQTDQNSSGEKEEREGQSDLMKKTAEVLAFSERLRLQKEKGNGRNYGMKKGYSHRWGAFIDGRRGFWREGRGTRWHLTH